MTPKPHRLRGALLCACLLGGFLGASRSLASGPATFLISPTSFDFGDVAVGSTSPDQTVTVTNVSGVPQTVSMAGGGAGLFGGVQNCQSHTLAPGASCQIFYQFTPTATGPATGSTGGSLNGQPFAFAFQGNGIDQFLVTPIGFDFGDVAVSSTSPSQTVNVTNVGTSSVVVSMAGGGAGVFGGSQNCQSHTLAPDASCQIFYQFTPTMTGPATGSTGGSLNGQAFAFGFQGNGGSSGATFLISPTSFDFGDVAVGSTAPSQTVNVTNVGASSVVVSMAGGGAGLFGGSQNCQGHTLAPGASCQIFYQFTPTATGPATGSTGGSVNGQPFAFGFQGNGIDQFLVSPIGFDFGDVAVSSTSPSQTVNVTNVGTSSVVVSMAGGGAGAFGGSQNCQGHTLAPDASCQIFYQFTPAKSGPATGSTSGSVNGQAFAFSFKGNGAPEPASTALGLTALAATASLARRRRALRAR